MKRTRFVALFLVVLVFSVGVSIAYAQGGSRQTWDYMLLEWNAMGEDGLARLGAQGWELVSVTPELKRADASPSGTINYESETWFYFKRPR
jgi:hypothetical protein